MLFETFVVIGILFIAWQMMILAGAFIRFVNEWEEDQYEYEQTPGEELLVEAALAWAEHPHKDSTGFALYDDLLATAKAVKEQRQR